MIYSVYWNGLSSHYTVPILYGTANFQATYSKCPNTGPLIPFAGKVYNLRKQAAEFIRNSKDCSFVFILTLRDGSYPSFKKWLIDEELESYVVCHPDKGFSNPNYVSIRHNSEATVGNLRLAVLASTEHSMREQFTASKPELIKLFNSELSVA